MKQKLKFSDMPFIVQFMIGWITLKFIVWIILIVAYSIIFFNDKTKSLDSLVILLGVILK